MSERSTPQRWTRHFVSRREQLRTTWKLRLGLLALAAAVLWLGRPWWTVAIARGLVCETNGGPSDAILVENFDADYFVFERAAELRRQRIAPRVVVPVWADPSTAAPNDVALGTTEVMQRISRLGPIDVIPIQGAEPISLNVARDVRQYLAAEGIRSVTLVSPLYRSRRSALVYAAVLGEAGVTVRCQPAKALHGLGTWTQSWHGIEDVLQQWVKLQYYRLYVLPFRRSP